MRSWIFSRYFAVAGPAAEKQSRLPLSYVPPVAIAAEPQLTSLTILRLLGPFGLGYMLSYLFRVINASIAGRLVDDLGLDASALGFIAAAYFITFSLCQVPLGVAFDRFGPRRAQGTVMALAGVGALLFATSRGAQSAALGRALIGIGVAGALMAGLKAISQWFPPGRLVLVNGIFVAFGTLGAAIGTLPTEWMLGFLTWRQLFVLLAVVSFAGSALILAVAPDAPIGAPPPTSTGAVLAVALAGRPQTMSAILCDRVFWRLAPLAALIIGSAWALQGLWAGPWLRDVIGLPQADIARLLLYMALSLSSGALLLGIVADRLTRAGVPLQLILARLALLYIGAECLLIVPYRPLVVPAWCCIAALAASTVVAYTLNAAAFPKQATGRANGAMALVVGLTAFLLQWLFGVVVAHWPRDVAGHYPPAAYAAGLAVLMVLQIAALAWFVSGWQRTRVS